jgi:hypothetical protein
VSAGARVAREVVRSAAWLVVVLGVTMGALAILDAVPAWLNGGDRDVRPARTLEDAERRVRARLVLPGYFPDTIAWPPARIQVLPGSPPAVIMQFRARSDGAPRMVLAQTVGLGEIPERLLPRAAPVDEATVAVAGGDGSLRRIVGPDGEIWRELAWSQDGRTVVARSKGSVDELLRMARSARVQP